MSGGAHDHTTADITDFAAKVQALIDAQAFTSFEITDFEARVKAIIGTQNPPPPPPPDPDPVPTLRYALPDTTNYRKVPLPATGKQTLNFGSTEDVLITVNGGHRQGATVINGGRNVVINGGRWNIDAALPIPTSLAQVEGSLDHTNYRVFTVTGTTHLWLANLRSDNPTNRHCDFLAGGGGTWTLQNIRAENMRGLQDGWHADFAQCWNALTLLRTDRITLYTNYQGFYFYGGNRPSRYELNRMDLHHVAYSNLPRQSAMFWTSGATNGTMSEVYIESPRPDGSNGPVRWTVGKPPGGEFVP